MVIKLSFCALCIHPQGSPRRLFLIDPFFVKLILIEIRTHPEASPSRIVAKIGRRRRDRHEKGPKPRKGGRKMGNEESTLKPEAQGPPVTLSARNLKAVADHITSGEVRRIVVMTGAGISTAAGSMFTSSVSLRPPLLTDPASSRLPLSRHRPLRQPGPSQPPLRRGRLRHQLLP